MFNKNASLLAAGMFLIGLSLPLHGVYAQTVGSQLLSIGALRYQPNDSSDPLQITSPVPSTIPNTGFSISAETTFAATYEYFLTDHVGIEALIGVPPKHTLSGEGALSAGPLNPLGTVRNWSVPILLRYHFNEANDAFRPYLGLGLSYNWYTDISVSQQFQRYLSARFTNGATTAAPTTADVGSKFAPVFNIGATYAFNREWGLIASFSYLPLKVKAKLHTQIAPGTTVESEGNLTINPSVYYLGITRTF